MQHRETERWTAVVDDDAYAREACVALLRAHDFTARGFASAREFLEASRGAMPDALVLDVDIPEIDGFGLQRELARERLEVSIVFVTGCVDVSSSVRAIKAGAVDYLPKPYDPDVLLAAVREAHARTTLQLRAPRVSRRCGPLVQIVGESAPLHNVLRQIERVAPTDSTVLIEGETGTGKELVARSIHELSPRAKGPFVKVNCAAIPAALLESELMGHERGAFTGALARRIGRFEQADGGTIFLDEIGDMPLDLQPKLLRLLQERELERLGGSATIGVDVRVVAATNKDLAKMARERSFREDLYYRLSVFPIFLPSLRERRDDIPALCEHFSRLLCERFGQMPRMLTEATLHRLTEYTWPGNIRELQNVLERAAILAGESAWDPFVQLSSTRSAAAAAAPLSLPNIETPSDTLEDHTRAHILKVLEATNWVVAGPNGAAARLRLARTTLTFRMKKLGIERPPRRGMSASCSMLREA